MKTFRKCITALSFTICLSLYSFSNVYSSGCQWLSIPCDYGWEWYCVNVDPNTPWSCSCGRWQDCFGNGPDE